MKINVAHCLFEQSGTFRNAFLKLHIPAFDYDIQNEYGFTDVQIDLFEHIENAYLGRDSIFDTFQTNDLVLAFFPCIYFCENNQLQFTANHHNLSTKPFSYVAEYLLDRNQKRAYFYEVLLKLFAVCERNQLRLIVENPYSVQHYLINNFPFAPRLIDKDRSKRGDYFKKPTMYFFLNCEPTDGYTYQPTIPGRVAHTSSSRCSGVCSAERSMISPDYAYNFICDNILGLTNTRKQLKLF